MSAAAMPPDQDPRGIERVISDVAALVRRAIGPA